MQKKSISILIHHPFPSAQIRRMGSSGCWMLQYNRPSHFVSKRITITLNGVWSTDLLKSLFPARLERPGSNRKICRFPKCKFQKEMFSNTPVSKKCASCWCSCCSSSAGMVGGGVAENRFSFGIRFSWLFFFIGRCTCRKEHSDSSCVLPVCVRIGMCCVSVCRCRRGWVGSGLNNYWPYKGEEFPVRSINYYA